VDGRGIHVDVEVVEPEVDEDFLKLVPGVGLRRTSLAVMNSSKIAPSELESAA
jgi:hypothetical protein